MDNFANDLEVGKLMESYICNRWKKKFPNAEIKENGKFSGYDIHLNDDENRTIEVKQDFRCISTGNIGAEIIMNGSPSALLVTEAYLWVIVTGYRIYYIKPKRLWQCILDNDIKLGTINPNGDNNKIKWIYLIPEIESFMDYNYIEKPIITLTPNDPEYVVNFVKKTYRAHNYSYLFGIEGLEEIWDIAYKSKR